VKEISREKSGNTLQNYSIKM